MSPNVTLADVASHAGVSKMTVSKVINKKPGISEPTRERVLQSIRELGYSAHLSARALAGGRTDTLGLVVPQDSWPFVSELVRGIDTTAFESGLELLISTTQERQGHAARNIERLTRGLVDGLVLVLPRTLEWYTPGFQQRGVPVVVVVPGWEPQAAALPTVDADHYHGARLAMSHLLSLGHRRIGFVTGDHDAASPERLRGYREGLLTAGISLDPELEQPGAYSQPGGFLAAHRMLRLPEPPTAIFAANDLSAFGAIEAVKDLGLRVPDDVSVIGFDDIPQASQVHPPLTTIRQPLREMGAAGTRQLIGLLRRAQPAQQCVVLPTELVRRASTAVPRVPAPSAAQAGPSV